MGVLWVALMVPALIIVTLWTLISTPTASMVNIGGDDHFVCNTGGFTGEPGGLVFFFLLTSYGALILIFGVFLSIVSRNVPAMFNESKLLAISIYNLIFLSAVIIPVFLVLQPINPFVAWILRTCAILYAFTATMVLQFLPSVFGIVVLDRFTNPVVSITKNTSNSNASYSKVTASH